MAERTSAEGLGKSESDSYQTLDMLSKLMSFIIFCIAHLGCDFVISPPTALGTPTLTELSNELVSIVDWHSLGVKLGIEDYELDTIGRDYHGDNRCCKDKMLSRWLRVTELPTWKAVVDALCLMGENAVAAKIKNKYCSSSIATGKATICCILVSRLLSACFFRTCSGNPLCTPCS